MLLSVIIPVYNTAKYIEKCVLSVVNTSFTDYEIILVDDGSTDKSLSIMEELQKKYHSTIRIIRQANSGQGSARNVGIPWRSVSTYSIL